MRLVDYLGLHQLKDERSKGENRLIVVKHKDKHYAVMLTPAGSAGWPSRDRFIAQVVADVAAPVNTPKDLRRLIAKAKQRAAKLGVNEIDGLDDLAKHPQPATSQL